MKQNKYILWFSEVDKHDIELVGGKGANLGEMVKASFPVPNGFIVTSHAYYTYLKENNLVQKIKHILNTANLEKPESLMQVSKHIKKYIMDGKLSEELVKEIFNAYKLLSGPLEDALVAVRSSATAEDLPTASFAGQQETFLNVKGEAVLVQKIKEAWASLFNERAIFYREEQKFSHFKVGIAIPVQKMVQSEKSGVMFSIDPITNDKSKIIIEAIYGLGELIVQGAATPDHYEVSKKDLKILSKSTAYQKTMLKKVGTENKEVKLSENEGSKQKITDNNIMDLALLGRKLEKHYYFPQDTEWAIEKNTLYLVQTRPVTTLGNKAKDEKVNEEDEKWKKANLLLKGSPASPGMVSGPARIIKSAKEIGKVLSGEVLVAPQTNPDFVPAMKKAVAIVTDAGGRTSHAAIVSRELGIPAVVGAENATKQIKNGMVITVNGSLGEIYKGSYIQSEEAKGFAKSVLRIKTRTNVYVNLAQPDLAEKVAQKNADGIGLLRAEFMIANIGTHPKKLIRDGKGHVFTEKLTESLLKFCKAFHPRPVVYRASDFKTNEYRNLIGGKDYEPHEENPMLGYRGAFRYVSDPNVFNLELEAIKRVRNKHHLDNLWLMIPFVRTVEELNGVMKLVEKSGLKRSSSFKLWVMVEIPSNVILVEDFIKCGIDGVSIGSNDLTMLILGTDRDNSEVAQIYNERNPAVLWAFEKIITTCKKHHITCSMCGQAPSQYPDLVEKLVEWGITSVSVSPDAIDVTRENIAIVEKKLDKK
ncbi:MAG: phosphoenolpyruvate synthase [Candidatus Levyibacteriota bacterium]|nr:MAG: phosphoenolpyruvate synthase [Candidatus Levybacteria bacterium]